MDVNVDKFPLIFREKIKSGIVVLPPDIETDYSPIKAYRRVIRETNDKHAIDKNDFLSYAELGKNPPRTLKDGIKNPDYYSTSFFSTTEALKNCFHFPHPKNKVIVGNVYCEGGPCSFNEASKHIHWWMYEDASISSFTFLEENNE